MSRVLLISKKPATSISEDLTFKQERLKKIQKAKKALEEREQALNPDKPIDDKKTNQFCRS